MRWTRPDLTRSTWIAAVVLPALLAVLAILQYRWIGEVSAAERQRTRAGLHAAGERFADDLGQEVMRAFFAFQSVPPRGAPGREPGVAERWRRWRETASMPRLVRDVYLVGREADGQWALTRIDSVTDRGAPAPWSEELLPVRKVLESAETAATSAVPSPQRPSSPLEITFPALLMPLHRHTMRDESRYRQGAVIVMLDRRFLAGELFPELAERCFGVSKGPDYLVAVAGPGGIVYRSDPQLPAARYLPGEIALKLFAPHGAEGRHPRPGQRQEASLPGSWRLVISHRDGSLEAAVQRVRWRNLAVSLGVLTLLAVTLAVLAVSAQRARNLARQQIEFVAGVTHELNTPLAAIRSAGQNLADGVVSDAQQVKRYGALIEREGRRLSGMVAKALELAGIQSGNKSYRPEPVALSDLVDEALADCRWVLEEKGVAVERDLPFDLPPVAADRASLRMAVQNLLDNAVKYAGAARWIGVRARTGQGGQEVSLIIEDRGPGIRAEDRPHLFEPFYRGRHGADGTVHGSGLGLSLVRHAVEANRGSLSVATGPGGSAFTIRLPVAAAQGAAE